MTLNALAQAVAGMAATLNRVAGSEVTYSRKGMPEFQLTAIGTNQQYQVIRADSTYNIVSGRDFLVRVCDLRLDGDPREGDELAERINGTLCRFRALPLGDRPCFEEHDDMGVQLVIHTIEVGADE